MYNLLQEPWVCVADKKGVVQKVSLRDVFLHAHEYAGFAGDNKAQDVALLRLCLTILHRVFSRVDAKNHPYEQTGVRTVLQVWKSLWDLGKFPNEPIQNYLDEWEYRFDLYDEKRPFFQVPAEFFTEDEKKSKEKLCFAVKLDGNILKSENLDKIHIGKMRGFSDSIVLAHDEAARWLVYHQCFDVASGKGYYVSGSCPVGLGLEGAMVYIIGDSLWETMLLNFVMLENGQNLYDYTEYQTSLTELPTIPCWEWDDTLRLEKESEHITCSYRNNPISILNLQSRRIHLNYTDDGVNGYWSTYGDVVDMKNNLVETMLIYTVEKKTGDRKLLKVDSSRFWEQFKYVTTMGTCGLTAWLSLLERQGILQKSKFLLAGLGFTLKPMNAAIDEMYHGEMTLQATLFQHTGKLACSRLADEFARVDKLKKVVFDFAKNLMYCKMNPGSAKSVPIQITGYAKGMEARYMDEVDKVITTFLINLQEEDVSADGLDATCEKLNVLLAKQAFRFGAMLWSDANVLVNRNATNANVDAKKRKSPEEFYLDFRKAVGKALTENKQK